MYKFKNGDKVIAISPPDGNNDLINVVGLVCGVSSAGRLPIAVMFENKYGKKWNWRCEEDSLRLVNEYITLDY